jgi:predicted nicotinamide N-methyase
VTAAPQCPGPPDAGPPVDLVPERMVVAGIALDLLRPADPDALLDDAELDEDERLPYWAQLWPSARALVADLVRRELRDVDVLELGCGLGVPSLVAAARGARVTATDWAPEALALLRRNAARNDLTVEARCLDWFAEPPAGGAASGAAAPRRWSLVLASDVLYERRNVPALLRTLDRLVDAGGEAWIADPGRGTADDFWDAAAAAWDAERRPRAPGGSATVTVLRRR